jgi:Ca2+-binding EF-hand superfamily protein
VGARLQTRILDEQSSVDPNSLSAANTAMSDREKLKRVFDFVDVQREGYITLTKLKKALVARPYVHI